MTNGVVTNQLGDVGDTVASGGPKWRGTFSAIYRNDLLRSIPAFAMSGGGKFNHAQNIVNNDISARIYVDVGAEFYVERQFTFFLRVNNLFDKDPPLVTTTYNPMVRCRRTLLHRRRARALLSIVRKSGDRFSAKTMR